MLKISRPAGPALEPLADGELFDLLYEESPTAIATMDPQGRITALNRAAVQLLARSRAEVVGRPLLEQVLPGDRTQVRAKLQACLSGRVVDENTRISRGDGATRMVRLHAVPVVQDAGVARVEVFLDDITNVPFGTTEDPAFYRLLEQVPGQFALLLDRNGRIRRSVGLARTHWLNDGDCIGRSYSLLLAADEANKSALEELTRERKDDEGWSGVVWHVRADGARLPVRVFAMAYRDPRTQEVRGTLLVGRDTSAEQALEQRSERLERLAAVGELVAGIATELRRAIDAVGEELRSAESVRRMRDLLDSIGAFTTTYLAGSGAQTDVGEEARGVARTLSGTGTRIHVEVVADLPEIGAERSHVQMVLRELVRNAVEASGPAGTVNVRVEPHGGGVRVRVVDDGPGLEPLAKEHACEPFVTTKAGHLGLGLAIARGIVALYGGRVQVFDGYQGGAVAEAEFPPTRPDPSVFRPMKMLLARGRSVLVVDDDQSVRVLLRTVLERVGFKVQEAWSGRSALATITGSGSPDIVLTDIKMGGGSGYWLLSQLRRYEPGLLERTVIITGYSDDEQISELALATGCPVVRKPLDFHLLIELMNNVLLKSAR